MKSLCLRVEMIDRPLSHAEDTGSNPGGTIHFAGSFVEPVVFGAVPSMDVSAGLCRPEFYGDFLHFQSVGLLSRNASTSNQNCQSFQIAQPI